MGLLCCALVFGVCTDVQAQTKKKKKKATTTQTTKKKKAPAPAPVSQDVELPLTSNDCLFALTLEPDKPFGPTTAPDGGGRIQEVVADKAIRTFLNASTIRCGTNSKCPTTGSWKSA